MIVSSADPESEAYRGYCLEHVAAFYDVVLISGAEPTWEARFITDHALADPVDEVALAAAGQALSARHQLSGVMTWFEDYLVPVARLARLLGLPTSDPTSMQAARNKAVGRRLFAQHQVPSAESISVSTLQEATLAAETIGYPVVLKPAAHAASIGVIRVDSADDLPDGYSFAAAGASHGVESQQVLVEEYLAGPEISVECATYQGRTLVVAVTRKSLGPEPHFEEIAHSVDAADPLLATVAPVAAAAVAALGITDGIQHVEMRLVDGQPRMIELNGRVGGDLIGLLVHRATGISLPRAAADIACGTAPDLTPDRAEAAAIELLYPDTSGTLVARHFPGRAADRAPWLDRLHWQRQVGDQLLLPQDGGDLDSSRIGFAITTGPTAAVARFRADEVARALVIDVEPTAQPVATVAV
ncbi:ATP-grasp domain-containing protein [Streptomyces sp. NPDC087440]|uniref:ATP-grasp domain-containing protein n=1 Tax=Streptomyces sp. NPDC087440 TaxID=3365790 RepID=UPI003807C283